MRAKLGFLFAGSLLAALLGACRTQPLDEVTGEADEALDAEMSLPIDADKLTQHLRTHGIKKKEAALAALPAQLKTHVVFVTTTGGLGSSSRARPRPVHFAEDARFILASSGHADADDPTGNALEILEYDEATHAYHAHTLELDPVSGPQLVRDDARCVGCHGSPARPIWGAYPNWPSAYGGSQGHAGVDAMTPAERADFGSFLDVAKTDPDYKHLRLYPNERGYYLQTAYGYPLTLFTARVGVRYATELGARVMSSPSLRDFEYALLAEGINCSTSAPVRSYVDAKYAAQVASDPTLAATNARFPATRTATKLYRLLGIEPAKDLRLELPVSTPPAGEWEVAMNDWNAGGDYLPKLVEAQVLQRVLATDTTLAGLYQSRLAKIDTIGKIAFRADANELAALTDASELSYRDSIFPFLHYNVHYPVLNAPGDTYPGEGKRAAVCAHLDSAQRARQ